MQDVSTTPTWNKPKPAAPAGLGPLWLMMAAVLLGVLAYELQPQALGFSLPVKIFTVAPALRNDSMAFTALGMGGVSLVWAASRGNMGRVVGLGLVGVVGFHIGLLLVFGTVYGRECTTDFDPPACTDSTSVIALN